MFFVSDVWAGGGALTVCPWNVLMGRSCPSLHTWMHMSVLQEANVLLLCQSTSRAGAEEHIHTVKAGTEQEHIITGQNEVQGFTWVERKLLFGFSCVGVPYDCGLRHMHNT